MLSTDQLSLLSVAFPKLQRGHLIDLRMLLNSYTGGVRVYKGQEPTSSFDMDALAKRVTTTVLEAVKQLAEQGVCLEAIARTPMLIPMSNEPIIYRF